MPDQSSPYRSRKLWFSILCLITLVGTWILSGFVTSLAPTYTILVGGILGIGGLYLGGNVAHAWVQKNQGQNSSGQ